MLTFENAVNTYNVFNGVKYDTSDEHDKYLLCCQFLVYACDGCNIAPLTDYANNVVYQKLSNEKDHFSSLDKKLYTDLRRSKGYTSELQMILRDDSNLTQTITLKKASENKIKLRVTGYYKGKNICIPFQEVV